MTNRILKGTLILFIAGLATRILGFFYRIFLVRLLGDQGLGLLQMVFPVLGLAITLSTAGIPLAISIMVAERLALRPNTIRKVMRLSLQVVGGLSLLISLLLYSSSHFISAHFLTDPRSHTALMVMIPLLPIASVAAIFHGYFQGLQRMGPTALARVVEQLSRIGAVVLFIARFLPYGLGWAAAGAGMGVVIGELAGLLVLLLFYWLEKIPIELGPDGAPAKISESSWEILQELFRLALPVTGTRIVGSISDMLDATVIPRQLELAGFTKDGATAYLGRLSGMALPLLFFPTVITFALASALVPAISEDHAKKDYDGVRRKAEKSMHLTLLVALPSSAIFFFLGQRLGAVIYGHQGVGNLIAPLALVAPFLYLEATTSAILRGLGLTALPMVYGLIGSFLRLILIYFFAANPEIGSTAVIWGIGVDLSVSFFLNYGALHKRVYLNINLANWLLKPIFASGVMIFAIFTILPYLHGFNPLISTTMAILSGGFLYMLILYLTHGLVTKEVNS